MQNHLQLRIIAVLFKCSTVPLFNYEVHSLRTRNEVPAGLHGKLHSPSEPRRPTVHRVTRLALGTGAVAQLGLDGTSCR